MKKTLHSGITALMVLLVLLSTSCGTTKTKKHLGIATYSVKGLESDIEGAFKALADDGYVVMEISNYDASKGTVAGYSPADYAALAEKYGMKIISSHVRSKFDVSDEAGTLAAWDKVFDDHKAMGCKYVVLPMNFWSRNIDTLKLQCNLLDKIGDEANSRGLQFGYHNHNMEFAKVGGTDQNYEDFLINNTDPEKVFFEMDVYWVTVGGEDPVAYLVKYPDRFKVLHIKDDYVIGASGKIDYKAIFDQFYNNGYKDWFVEIEDKMTPEQREQNMAMMNRMKEMQANGGGNPFTRRSPRPPQGDNQGARGERGRGRQADTAAARPPGPGFGQQDPQVVAQKLKDSLEACKESAEYLEKADFVK